MELVILGASGFIGSAITAEALARGHQVTAVVSRPERVAAQAGLTVVGLDINDTPELTRLLSGKAVVISAFSGHAQQDVKGNYPMAAAYWTARSFRQNTALPLKARLKCCSSYANKVRLTGAFYRRRQRFFRVIKPAASGWG